MRVGASAVDAEQLGRLGLEAVHVGGGGATTALLRLSLDAVSLATAERGSGERGIGEFVVITGAVDVSPLVVALRRHGARR